MNKPLNMTRILSLAAAAVLCGTMFTGCFSKSPAPPTEPPAGPNLAETTEATNAPTVPTSTTATVETTEAPKKKNVATVKERAGVRSAPTNDSNVLSTLNAGDEVEVNRVETNNGTQWAYIPLKGWVDTQYLDMTNVTVGGSTTTPAATNPPATTAPAATTPAATTPAAGNGNTGTTNTTTGGKKGVVTANDLNIRQSAGTNSDIVGKYSYGTRISILETSNGWGRTDKGWVSLAYVYQDGATGKNTAKGLVTGTTLNVRSGPGTNYDSVSSYGRLTRVNILEQIKVGNTTWGCTKDGWISMDYVYVDGTKGEGAGTGTVTGDNVNIRSGPGTKYDAVGSAHSGDEIEILAQFEIGNMTWGCTSKGWICMDYVGIG